MRSPSDSLESRRPVWEAMSAVFLDTEVDDAWLKSIADVLVGSGYSDRELEHIFWNEVCPQLHWNALSVAGEWAGFDMDAVELNIVQNPPGRLRQWFSHVNGGRVVKLGWLRVKAAVAARRAT